MSYDFRLFQPQPGVDSLDTAQAESEDESEEINVGPKVPAKELRKQSVAAALVKANPSLKVFGFAFEKLAKSEGISVESAQACYRHIELNGPENGNGIQITIFDDTATITVPYWHKGKKAQDVFREIWLYLSIIQEVAGYEIYDPQLDRIICLDSDMNDAMTNYADVLSRMGWDK